jgi:hypothetical protein
MNHFLYVLWSLFAIETNVSYDYVEMYCPKHNTEISAIECDVKINLFDELSDKEFIDYVSDCLQQKSKMFLL